MPRIVSIQEIAQPPRVVFAFFVPQRLGYWYGAEMRAEIEVAGGAGEFVVGQKVRISGTLAGKSVAHTFVITECRWGEVFEWKFVDAYGVRGTERWEFSPVAIEGAAGTRVRTDQRLRRGGIFCSDRGLGDYAARFGAAESGVSCAAKEDGGAEWGKGRVISDPPSPRLRRGKRGVDGSGRYKPTLEKAIADLKFQIPEGSGGDRALRDRQRDSSPAAADSE